MARVFLVNKTFDQLGENEADCCVGDASLKFELLFPKTEMFGCAVWSAQGCLPSLERGPHTAQSHLH